MIRSLSFRLVNVLSVQDGIIVTLVYYLVLPWALLGTISHYPDFKCSHQFFTGSNPSCTFYFRFSKLASAQSASSLVLALSGGPTRRSLATSRRTSQRPQLRSWRQSQVPSDHAAWTLPRLAKAVQSPSDNPKTIKLLTKYVLSYARFFLVGGRAHAAVLTWSHSHIRGLLYLGVFVDFGCRCRASCAIRTLRTSYCTPTRFATAFCVAARKLDPRCKCVSHLQGADCAGAREDSTAVRAS